MQPVVIPDVDHASVQDAVGPAGYSRGVRYAEQGAVLSLRWESGRSALHGMVRGSAGERYATTAFFLPRDGLPMRFDQGICSCPVGFDCKHAVALILTARTTPTQAAASLTELPDGSAHADASLPDSLPGQPLPGPTQAPPTQPAPWQRSLDSLLTPAAIGPPARTGYTPLAVELTLVPLTRPGQNRRQPGQGSGQPGAAPVPLVKLAARLVQAGKNGGWVAGALSWTKLESLRHYGNYSPEHLRLLSEIYGLYRSRGDRPGYYYYGDEKHIDLSAFESRQIWPLLDEAASCGLPVLGGPGRHPMGRPGVAELRLDVTASGQEPGSLVVTPVLTDGDDRASQPMDSSSIDSSPMDSSPMDSSPMDSSPMDSSSMPASPAMPDNPAGLADAVPLRFIGADGHGVVYADRAEVASGPCASWHFRLARLTRAVPPQLQTLALAGQCLAIPATDLDRFKEHYYPRLRNLAPLVSSDRAFEPPEIRGPVLALSTTFHPGHRADADWAWVYHVGEATLRTSPRDPVTDLGYRDLTAERQIVERLAGSDLPLGRLGLIQRSLPAGAELTSSALHGLDTMLLATELLRLLPDEPGVVVEVAGSPADYREASDALSISVSADEVAGDNDWYDLGITIAVEGQEVPFSDVFVALSQGLSHALLADGTYFSLDKPELTALARLIDEARSLRDAPPGELRISRFQAGLWEELAEIGEVSRQAATWRQQVQGLLSLQTIERAAPPSDLRATMRPYQLEGFWWLAFLWRHQLGGILADDMGLGKTLQTLALISHAAERAGDGRQPHGTADRYPFLIVAPTSVIPNWAEQAKHFTPGLHIVPVTETQARRRRPLAEVIDGADAVVTSYTLLRIDFEAYAARTWAGLILDEAQFVKNHQSKVHQCARKISAPFKIAVTGTPLENNLMELWSLLSITAPGLFPSPARFREYYARPIETQPHGELLAQLRRRIRPLVLRRTKEQVAAELPARQEQVLVVDLHPRHRKLYQTYLQRERQKVLGLIGDMSANRFAIFRSLTLLRQLSLDPGLVTPEHATMPVAKVDVLLEQLADVTGSGHRALVFSQFTRFLRTVRDRLDAAEVPYCYLDGRTKDRAQVLGRFREGTAPVFLISLKAGGFGLNLTEADYCFLLDPWWNPATEAQAVDRVHRIGQTRTVMVYRLIARDTIEEKVMALKARKAELFASVLAAGDGFGAGLDAEDIRGLFA